MPELPEVETVRRSLLEGGLAGLRIRKVRVDHQDAVHWPDAGRFARELVGQRIDGVRRRGKFLLLDLDDRTLVCHLRMTGRLWLSLAAEPELTHTHVVFDLSDGRQLRFRDVRRFGGFTLLEPDGSMAPALLGRLGPEPEQLTPDAFAAACARRGRSPVKSLLLDQSFVAGIGNIYADEALHRAGVHPVRTCGSLSKQELRDVRLALRAVLRDALRHHGTTFLDFRDGQGEPGAFQAFLRVYGREGLPCRRCGTPVAKMRVAARGTHFCPRCQPEGE